MNDESSLRSRRARWMRPAAHLWIRHDAYRFMPPGAPRRSGKDVVAYFWPEAKSYLPSPQNERKYNSDQPRVPRGEAGGGQWTSGGGGGGGSGEGTGSGDAGSGGNTGSGGREQPTRLAFLGPLVPAAGVGARFAIQKSIEAGLALYTALSARNSPDTQAVVQFTARDFRPAEAGKATASVGTLTEDQVEAVCPRLPEVQERTEAAVAAVESEQPNLTAQQYGTAVHTNLKRQIDALEDPNFVAERSFLKEKTDVSYGTKDSIRIDVFENVGDGTVCVYDLKTGSRGLSMPRMAEITGHVFKRYPTTSRIIVTEIRPSR